ncbi:MAG: MFS transporter [candidate division Zixibacteria bacterium]|nr:MFS transporter [candidate division Zixibacteria bacterium]
MKPPHSENIGSYDNQGLTVSKKIDPIGQLDDYWKHLQLFSRNVRLYLTGSFLIGLTFACYLLLMNLYLREQGIPESFIGKVLSFGALGMTLMAIPAAFVLRRIRLKKILLLSTTVYVLAILFLTQIPASSMLFVLSFLAGMAMTFYRVAAGPFFMRNSTPKERTYIFSVSFGVSLLASMIGSLIFGEMVTLLSSMNGGIVAAYRWAFVLAGGLGLLAVLPFGLIKAADPSKADKDSDFSFDLLKRRIGLYGKLFFPHFIVGSGAGLIIPFLNLYFRDRFGQPTDNIGWLYFVGHTTMLIGILAGPVLVKKIGMIRSVVLTQLLSMPFMVILAYTYSLPMAIGAFLMRGALMNLGVPIGSNFGMEMVSKSEQALVNALLMLSWTSSWMVSTYYGGRLIESYGYTLPLMIAVGLYFVSSVSYYFFFRDSEIKTDSGYKIEATG